MFFPVDSVTRRRAKSAHELAMVNLLLVNLLMLIALLAGSFLQHGSPLLDYKLVGVVAPFIVSMAIIFFTFIKASKSAEEVPWFVTAHWRLASARYKILLFAYGIGVGLIGVGWLLSTSQKTPGMQELMFVALQRVAIAPVLVTLMVIIMLEAGALYQAGRGEIPDGMIKKYPPPESLGGGESEFMTEA